MHLHSVRPSLLLLGALGIAGCTAPPTAESIPQEQFTAELPAALCARSVRCGFIGRSEEASCRSNLANAEAPNAPPGSLYREAIAAGRIRFDGVAARKCIDYYRAQRCHEDGDNSDDLRACQRIYRPRVADGGACLDNLDCRSGTCNNAGPAGCPGVCAPTSDCNRLNCDEDSFCNLQHPACTPRRARGEPCDPPIDHLTCQPGLVCIGGLCDVPRQAGGPCGGLAGLCAAGQYCDSDTITCKPQLGAESACRSSLECQDGLVCVSATSPPTIGACKPVLDFPSACDPDFATAPAVCPGHAQCDPGTRQCVERPTYPMTSCATESCLMDVFYCDEGTLTCKLPLLPGAACTPPNSSDPAYNPCGPNGRCDATTRKCVLVCQ